NQKCFRKHKMQAIEVSEKTSESRLKKSKKGNELFTPDCTA
ncbi:MAG: hypothetical protein ACJAWV_004055, partial [Flammeovirgaceae bacterium]